MGRRGVSFEDVARAAEGVLASGDNPTVARIRTELGDTGSNYTISKYFGEWKQGLLTKNLRTEIGERLPSQLQSFVENFWTKLREEALVKNQEQQEQSQKTLQSAVDEKEALKLALENKKEAFDKLAIENNHLQANHALAQNELIKERQQRAVLEERIKSSEARSLSLVSETKTTIDEMKRAHEERVSDLKEQLKTALQELNEYKSTLENQRHQFIVQIDHSRTAKEKAENQSVKLQAELKQRTASLEEKNEQHRSVMVDLKILKQLNAELERVREDLGKQVSGLSLELKASRELLLAKDELIAELKQRFLRAEKQSNQKKDKKG